MYCLKLLELLGEQESLWSRNSDSWCQSELMTIQWKPLKRNDSMNINVSKYSPETLTQVNNASFLLFCYVISSYHIFCRSLEYLRLPTWILAHSAWPHIDFRSANINVVSLNQLILYIFVIEYSDRIKNRKSDKLPTWDTIWPKICRLRADEHHLSYLIFI